MNRSFKFLFGLLLGLGVAWSAQAQPTFDLSFTTPDVLAGRIDAAAGDPVSFGANCMLATGGLNPGDPGAQGWSLSVAATGCDITEFTYAGTVTALTTDDPPGLRIEGDSFEVTELVTGGVVSAVVLALQADVTLDPGGSPHRLLALTVGGTAPGAEGECVTCDLAYQDGLQGSGLPVDNKVTHDGLTVLPSLGSTSVDICVPVDCSDDPLNLIFQTTAIPDTGAHHLTPDLFANETAEIPVATGGTTPVYAAIVSQLPGGGVQGWSLAIRVAGNVLPANATTEGTVAAAVPEGLRLGVSFELTEVTADSPERPDNAGVVSAVVLALIEDVSLPPTGTATVLAFDLQGPAEGDPEGVLSCQNGLVGSGQPVENLLTVEGESDVFCECKRATVVVPQIADFIRCDPNNDLRNNIADAVWIVNELFRGGPPTACVPAADCNDDDQEDLSDAVFAIIYQFGQDMNPGTPPAAPFPDCGSHEDATVDNCPSGSTACP